MKKVLFATTALVAFAGAASADIAISGYAELGIVDADSVNATTGVVDATDTSTTQLHTDVDVTFSMTGETDGGLSFGVSVDLDEAGGLGSSSTNNGTAIFLSGAFGTLTVGNTDGAMDWALTEIVGPGSLTDSETAHEGFKGSYLDGSYDGQIARYNYTAGDLAFAASTEIADVDVAGRSNGYAVGVKYAINGINLGVAMQSADLDTGTQFANNAAADVDATGVSVSGTFGAVTAGVVYTAYDSSVALYDADHLHVGVSYTQGAMTLGANIGNFDSDTNAQDRDGYGITANYSLGGGATIQAGYESSERNNVDNGGSWSLGIAMAF